MKTVAVHMKLRNVSKYNQHPKEENLYEEIIDGGSVYRNCRAEGGA